MPENEIQRLKKQLKALRSKPDKGVSGMKKVELLNDLAFVFHTSDPQKTEDYAHQAFALAEKLHYRKGIASSYNNIGISHWIRGNFDKALECYFEALKIYRKIGEKKGTALIYNNIGNVYLVRSDYDKGLKYHLKALKIRQKTGDKSGIARSYGNIALINQNRGNYGQALEYHFKALKIYKQIGEKKGTALIYNNVGNVYKYQADYEQALEYHFKALQICEEIGDAQCTAMSSGNIGIVCDLNGEYDLALEYYLKALRTYVQIGEKNAIANSYCNIGITCEKQGGYDQALEYHLKALKIREEIDDKDGIAASYNNIGDIYEKQGTYHKSLECHLRALKIQDEIGDKAGSARSYIRAGFANTKLKHHDLAFRYLRKGLRIAQQIGIKDEQIDGYRCLSELYEAEQDYNKALSSYKKYTDVEKETYNAEKSKQIAEMHAKYETEKKAKEAELYHLKNVKLSKEIKERKEAEKELEKHRKHLEKLVAERTTQLRSLAHELSLVEEKQRRKIATYLHDDIAQALALATVRLELLHATVSKKNIKKELEAIKEIIDQTTARTRSLTFEISPPVLYDSGFEPAVEWLAEQFQNQHDIVCELTNDGLPKPISSDTKVILFQSVRELLTNVAKHAQARTVRVLTLKDGNTIRIEVRDDGIGFNPKILNQKITKNEGFGLFNLKERLRHLRGRLEVSSKVGRGTSVTIMAPLKSSARDANTKRKRM